MPSANRTKSLSLLIVVPLHPCALSLDDQFLGPVTPSASDPSSHQWLGLFARRLCGLCVRQGEYRPLSDIRKTLIFAIICVYSVSSSKECPPCCVFSALS